MIVLRQGKAKTLLESSRNSAINAVEIYNRPNTKFKIENYIILMIVSWTKLFHAFFQATMGERYFYKDKNGRYKLIDGERKAWELNRCINEFQKSKDVNRLSEAVVANLHFFIGIRNKVEHRHWNSSELDIILFGECQSLLFNYENLILSLFGDNYSINTCLAYALQFSQLRSDKQITSQKTLLSKDMVDIKDYIDKYKTSLSQTVYDSQEYSVKLLQIPKISNTNRSDLAVEFVNWSTLSENDIGNYRKITTIIKDKIVRQSVSNLNLLKPKHVIVELDKQIGIRISRNSHTLLWKAFSIRPGSKSKDKFNTNDKYCVYDEPHDDYLYTFSWVEFILRLIKEHGFTNENIPQKCKNKLRIDDYL